MSLASFLEYAGITYAAKIGVLKRDEQPWISAKEIVDVIWNEDETTRILNMQQHYPELLTNQEKRLIEEKTLAP